MLHLKSKKLVAGVLSLALGAAAFSPALAGPRPSYDQGNPPINRNDDGGIVAVNNQNLPAFLKNLGYEVSSVTPSSDGGKVCTVKFEADGWTFVVDTAVSSDGVNLWLSCILDRIPDNVPASTILGLLEKNDTIAPASFSYSASRNHLFLNQAFDNTHMTAALFREEMTKITTLARTTHSIWDMSRFVAPRNAVNNDAPPMNDSDEQNPPVAPPPAPSTGGYRLAR